MILALPLLLVFANIVAEVVEFHPASNVDLGLFCCSTVPYNNSERVSFVTSWTEQVNVTTVTTVKDDPCRFIFRPWLCYHNITDTRVEDVVRTRVDYRTIIREVKCDAEDIHCCDGLTFIGNQCLTDEEVLAYNAQQSTLDDILGDLW